MLEDAGRCLKMLKDQIAHDSSFQRPTGHAKLASEAVCCVTALPTVTSIVTRI